MDLKGKFVSGFLLACGFGNTVSASDFDTPLNIILIMADDFGYECLGINGSEYHTPHIDRLAEQGIRFTNCFSNPLSTPSRVQLMTGKYNVKNYIAFGKLDRKEVTLGNVFSNAGYATCIAGKWQLGKEKDSPAHFGFQQSCLWQHTAGAVDSKGADTRYASPIVDVNGELKEYPIDTFGPDVYSDFIIDFIRAHRSQPFFVYYPMCLTHCPFVSTPDSENWEASRSSTYKGDTIYYSDMVAYTDKMVGKIIDELQEQGLMDNTLIIFTGDNGTDTSIMTMLNGEPYRGGKGKTIDSGVHVPLVVYHPKGIKGVDNQQLIDFTDFLPTVCEAADIPINQLNDLDGISFYSSVIGKNAKERDWIYCWYAPRKVYDEVAQVFVRDETYKLYRDGRFYNVKQDFYELHPISVEKMDEQQCKAYHKLHEVMKHYEVYALKRRLNK